MCRQCENLDLAGAQKTYVCFFPFALTHVTNAEVQYILRRP